MRKVSEYVFRRDNGALHFVRALPKDVKSFDASILQSCGLPRHQYWRSLRTCDRREAVQLANAFNFQFEKQIAKARQLCSPSKPTNSELPEARGKRWVVPEDQDLERLVRNWLSAYEERFAEVDERRCEEQIGDLVATIASLRADWKHNSLPLSARMVADKIISEHQLAIIPQSPLHWRFVKLVHRGQIEYYQRLVSKLNGQYGTVHDQILFHPVKYENDRTQGSGSLVTVEMLAEKWLAKPGASTNPKTMDLKRTRIGIIVEALGPKRKVTSITREDCCQVFERVICKLPAHLTKTSRRLSIRELLEDAATANSKTISSSTQELYVANFRSLFKLAVKMDLRASNPADLLAVENEPSEPREPFSSDQLADLFNAPVFRGCLNDETGYKKPGAELPRRHRYWIPIIAVYSGMRQDEICQLGRDDIRKEDDVWYFRVISNKRLGKRTKTKNSARNIPVHPTLIKLGLLEYASDQHDGVGGLFPELEGPPNGTGSDKISKWFGRLCDSRDLSDPSLCFHSLRHNFTSALSAAGASPTLVDKFCGWDDGSMRHRYMKADLVEMSKWIKKVEYRQVRWGTAIDPKPTRQSLGEENSKTGGGVQPPVYGPL
ncbi:MAG: site-specific integrase [Pseudomonadota bacterium]